MQASPVLIAASANRFSSCSTLLPSSSSSASTLAFGSGKYVALWDVDGRRGVKETLRGHAGEVVAVKKLDGRSFISGDTSGQVRIWRSAATTSGSERWKSTLVQAHDKSISALAAFSLDESSDYLLLSASSDSTVRLWRIRCRDDDEGPHGEIEVLDQVSLGNTLALAASFAYVGSENRIVLAVGTTASKVLIYTISPDRKLSPGATLSGHADWVRCLSFLPSSASDPSSPILLASGSQDSYVRLWRLIPSSGSPQAIPTTNGDAPPPSTPVPKSKDPFEALDALEASLSDQASSASRSHRIEMKKHPICSGKDELWGHVVAEAVLQGHENWITDVRWCLRSSSAEETAPRLVSTSVDRSIILWTAPDSAQGLWLPSSRFGELSASTNLGYFGAHFLASPRLANVEIETVLASGWGGAWHVWRRERKGQGEWGGWDPVVAPTGHFGSVTGLDWDSKGEMVLTCSTDQTTRLWGIWRPTTSPPTDGEDGATWHEIARPQVHGHDLFDAKFVGSEKRDTFVSVGEEKVIRAFEATGAFARSVGAEGMRSLDAPLEGHERAEGAMVPALGLSNRVVGGDEGEEEATEGATVDKEVKEGLKHPPFEDQLLSSTLWPEVDKLFGHSSELLTLAASPSSPLFASACHASTAKHASIRIWDATIWRPVGKPLEWHGLSVTRLQFGDVGQGREGLVSVSRDRGWAVWGRGEDGQFALLQGREAAHTRIIYDVAWSPVGSTFATASRDKTVKIWSRRGDGWELVSTIKFTVGARAVAFAPLYSDQATSARVLLAVGLEDGKVVFYSSSPDNETAWTDEGQLDPNLAHVDAITRIAFCPRVLPFSNGNPNWRLASAGEDKTVRIVDLSLPSIVPA